VRRPEDYIPKMMELAGGRYVLSDLPGEDSARSTMNMQAEAFYAAARDADVLIYNATVDGGLSSMEELLRKADWLRDFKAVKEGQVWCTEQNMFQQTSGISGMIADLHAIFSGAADDADALTYLYRLH
jgi:iron complex transport system substrate-binding protein